MVEVLRTVQSMNKTQINVKRSIFTAYIDRCDTVEKAKAFIQSISKANRDATHNCWAYRVASDNEFSENSSDAGEPSGSAGLPILNTLRKSNLGNICVVVSRYFGGVKLGIRGLINAYSEVTRQVVESSKLITLRRLFKMSIEVDYHSLGRVIDFFKRTEGQVLEIKHSTRAVVTGVSTTVPDQFTVQDLEKVWWGNSS